MKETTQGRVYGRFSSIPQEKGDSYRRQTEGAAKYAERQGIQIIGKPYFDEGVSGKAGLNLEKEFGRLLREAKAGECIIVEALDRLGRQSPFLLGNLIYRTVVESGISIHVWQEGKTITPDNIDELGTQFSIFTGAAVGHQENRRKMIRLSETWEASLAQARKGIPTANLTKCLPQVFEWNDEKKQFIPNADIAKTVRRIFSEYNAGIGQTRIAQGLNKDNVPTLYHGTGQMIGQKKPWIETSIKKILRQKSYNGTLVIKGETFEGLVPKVVTDEVFNKTQMLLTRYVNRHGKTNMENCRVNNLFSGVAICKDCEGTVNVNVSLRLSGRKPLYYYRCKNARLKTCKHPHKMVNAEAVEYGFFKTFFGKGAGSLLKDDNRNVALKEKIEIAKAQQVKANAAISNLFDMVEAGDATAKERINKRRNEVETLQGEIVGLQAQLTEDSQLDGNINVIYDMVTMNDIWNSKKPMAKIGDILDDNESRKKLSMVFPSIFSKVTFDCPKGIVEAFSKDGKPLGSFNAHDLAEEASKAMVFKKIDAAPVTDFEPPKRTFKPRKLSGKATIAPVQQKRPMTTKERVEDFIKRTRGVKSS